MKKVFLIGALASFAFGFFDPGYVSKAEQELTLHYIHNKIYYPVYCRNEKVNGTYYILCSSGGAGADRSIGGLFKIVENGDGYKIFAVNGKAQQHADGKYETLIDPSLDIQKIMSEF